MFVCTLGVQSLCVILFVCTVGAYRVHVSYCLFVQLACIEFMCHIVCLYSWRVEFMCHIVCLYSWRAECMCHIVCLYSWRVEFICHIVCLYSWRAEFMCQMQKMIQTGRDNKNTSWVMVDSDGEEVSSDYVTVLVLIIIITPTNKVLGAYIGISLSYLSVCKHSLF